MCGIAGRANFRSGAPVDPATLGAMCDLLAHRGPDGHGVWTDDAVGFGHRRLAVIDLSSAGHQPMCTADGQLTVTYNGEIYNFASLREDLVRRGCRFRSQSDTEVLLEAYRTFGDDCVLHLRGMFAFAIWDRDARRLFAARDRAGQKPFYYRVDADGLVFASEPKAFLAETSFTPDADPEALFHYLSLQYVPTPRSAFRGVERLPPAHTLVVEDGTVTTHRYWNLQFGVTRPWREEEAVEALLDGLREATRMRLVSDVPLGAFLSGGVDSSLVVALMAEATSQPVKTFSIGFDEAGYNELPYASVVAKRFGTDHHEAIVRPNAVEILPALVWHYNEPFADSSAIPTMYLARMTREHVTVALNGDAGDENFAGYDRYVANILASRVDRVPLPMRRLLAGVAARVPPGASGSWRARAVRFALALGEPAADRHARWVSHFDGQAKLALCRPEFLRAASGADSLELIREAYRLVGSADPVDAMLGTDIATYLPDDLLVKLDIATMAYGLEGRSPFLDHRVMELAATLPSALKLKGRSKKHILKVVAEQFLPPEILHRPKMGFAVPLEAWFRADLRDMTHDILLGSRLADRGYFNQDVIARMVDEHERQVRSWHYPLWNLLALELWHRMFIDQRPTSAPVPS